MTQMVTREVKVATIRDLMVKMKPQIAMAAPRHLDPDRLIRIFMTSLQRTPKLAECTLESLFGAMLTATQLGLPVDGAAGLAYLIPYKTTCTLIVGYRGLMDLARRSGDVESIEARAVYANDKFEFCYGAEPKLTHVPTPNEDAGNFVAAYAVAHLKGTDRPLFDVMWKKDIDAIRSRSRAGQEGPWVTDYAEMARKTVVRRLCKYLPSSPDLQRAATIDEQGQFGMTQDLAIVDMPAAASDAKPAGPPKSLDDLTLDDPKPKTDGALSALRSEIALRFKTLPEDKQGLILEQWSLEGIQLIEAIDERETLCDIRQACEDAKLENRKKTKPKTEPEPAHA